ncbi:MAG: hypothetical protein FD143_141 [Ignavibacteria bacterium]|nr:MAG: hypothetical protein FD143_141 [Ignavibacteria bacterium]KAF0162444.1 MAG: hypothetical protein FD188_47 [Ignavibacteria bacterium]
MRPFLFYVEGDSKDDSANIWSVFLTPTTGGFVNLIQNNDILKNEEDVPKCSAKIYIEGKMVQCLESRPICQHYLNFGEVLFCNHPLKLEIADRTRIDNNKV